MYLVGSQLRPSLESIGRAQRKLQQADAGQPRQKVISKALFSRLRMLRLGRTASSV